MRIEAPAGTANPVGFASISSPSSRRWRTTERHWMPAGYGNQQDLKEREVENLIYVAQSNRYGSGRLHATLRLCG